jgi:hypothetical protein
MTKTMKFFAIFLTVALVAASAASYTVTFFQPTTVAGTDLKPGDYKVIVESDKAIISQGKQKVEAAVKIENSDSRFSSTVVRYTSKDGKNLIQEIRLGGTNTKLVFAN